MKYLRKRCRIRRYVGIVGALWELRSAATLQTTSYRQPTAAPFRKEGVANYAHTVRPCISLKGPSHTTVQQVTADVTDILSCFSATKKCTLCSPHANLQAGLFCQRNRKLEVLGDQSVFSSMQTLWFFKTCDEY